MHTYVCIYILCIYVCIHVYKFMYMYICLYTVCLHIYIHVYMFIYCVYTCIYAYTLYVYIYIHVYMCIHCSYRQTPLGCCFTMGISCWEVQPIIISHAMVRLSSQGTFILSRKIEKMRKNRGKLGSSMRWKVWQSRTVGKVVCYRRERQDLWINNVNQRHEACWHIQ